MLQDVAPVDEPETEEPAAGEQEAEGGEASAEQEPADAGV